MPPQTKWNLYEAALQKRYKSLSPWAQRILDIRHALGWSQRQFSHVSRVDYKIVRSLETGQLKHYYPRLVTIKKIRLVEAAYRVELARYKKNWRTRKRLNRLHHPRSHARRVTPPVGPPGDPAFVEALGGLERFAILKQPRYGRYFSVNFEPVVPRTDTYPSVTTAASNERWIAEYRSEQLG